MQRRNVDLPDPDGPIRHSTCPRPTSSVMPLSTANAPKLLHTRSALTIGVVSVAVVISVRPRHVRAGRGAGFDHQWLALRVGQRLQLLGGQLTRHPFE